MLGAHQLRKASVDEARGEAGSLMAHVIKQDRTFIISHADDPISEEEAERFRLAVDRRAGGMPLQYITGHQEFFGLDFEVNGDVLIPRPETELLVEAALKLLPREGASLSCDVGTGSGCIVISILHELGAGREDLVARAVAIDISDVALAVAQRNASRHGVDQQITFVESDAFAALKVPGKPAELFDLIVSNPPYVTSGAISNLQREVRDFEPRLALEAGADGLDIIKRLLRDAGQFLRVGGHFLFEIGFDQHEEVERLVDRKVWKLLEIHKDLQGIPRTVALQKV